MLFCETGLERSAQETIGSSLTQKRKSLKHYCWSSFTVFSGCLVLVVGARLVQHFPVTLTFLQWSQCGGDVGFFVNGRSLRMHPSDTLLVTVYTAPAQSLSAAEPPRKAPGSEGRHSHQFGWNLVLKTKSGTKAFFGRGQRYRRLAVQHPVGSCCFPDAAGRTFSVLSGMDKTSRSASVRVDRWHTGGALALDQAVPQCHRRPRSGNATGIHSNLW